MSSWQSDLGTYSHIMPHLLESGELSDVTCVVGKTPEQKTFQLHKFILSIRSEVFEKMFYKSFPLDGDIIIIPTIKAEYFEIMLKFIYTDKFEVSGIEDTLYTYFAAKEYRVAHLINLCKEYAEPQLCPNIACVVYDMAILLNDEELMERCEKTISKFIELVLDSQYFSAIPLNTVVRILDKKSHNFTSELLLFDSLVRWGHAELERQQLDITDDNLRIAIDSILHNVEFLGMTNDEFLEGPVMSGVLTKSEILSIGLNITVPGSVPLPEWCSKEKISKYFKVLQLHHVCPKWYSPFYFSPSVIECQLKVYGRDIIFKGLSFYAEYISVPKAVFFINDKVCPLIPSKYIIADKETNNMRLIMAEPVLMKESASYHIKVSLGCPVRFCKFSINSSVTFKTADVKFVIDYSDLQTYPKFYGDYYRGHFQELYYRLTICHDY